MTNTKIFLTGATGYIGGAILTRILAHKKRSSFDITILVRSAEKARVFEKEYGLKAVVGSQDDEKLLEQLVSEADVVFSVVNADALAAAQATLRGMRNRYESTGRPGTLIHTSGGGLLSDTAAGLYAGEIVYSDLNVRQLESLPETAKHREVDFGIIAADKQAGHWSTAGLANKHSIQIPSLIRASLDRGQAGIVGEGKNLWPNVHIDEVADLYTLLLDTALVDSSTAGHGLEGFYFAESGEHAFRDVGKAIGDVLVRLGISEQPEPTTFTDAEIVKYFKGSKYLGSNSRYRAVRSRALGWNPVKTTKDMLASIEPETNRNSEGVSAMILPGALKVPIRRNKDRVICSPR